MNVSRCVKPQFVDRLPHCSAFSAARNYRSSHSQSADSNELELAATGTSMIRADDGSLVSAAELNSCRPRCTGGSPCGALLPAIRSHAERTRDVHGKPNA